MKFYIDTSVMMSLFLADSNSPAVRNWFSGTTRMLVVSGWVHCEFLDSVGRLQRALFLNAGEADKLRSKATEWLLNSCERVPIEDGLFDVMSGHLSKPTLALKSKDALHLAAAMRHEVTLVTCDRNLSRVCSTLNVPFVLLLGNPH
jgi:uncharacterized protein